MKVPLVLVGFSGAGKTTVGEMLRANHGWKFTDNDAQLEKESGKLITDIIRVEGEEAFRSLEAETLKKVFANQLDVIALGGGALLNDTSKKLVESKGNLIQLAVSEEAVVERVAKDNEQAKLSGNNSVRPLLSNSDDLVAEVKALMEKRKGLYDIAKTKVWTEWCSPEMVATVTAREHETYHNRTQNIQIMPWRSPVPLTGITDQEHLSEVVVGLGCLAELQTRLKQRFPKASNVGLIVDENAYDAWKKELDSALSGLNVVLVSVPAGEQSKRLSVAERCCEQLANAKLTRNDVVVGFGGGVVGDLTGLVASLFMRGIGLVQVPTTVVAQVDSAIGGKTGVNLDGGKNLAGTFNPGALVLSDPNLLLSLPEREYLSGLAEVVKYGLILSKDFFEWFEKHTSDIRQRDVRCLHELIEFSTWAKLTVVTKDLRDITGLRARLNFGHTVGHAIEKLSGYGAVLHGEAVSIGMVEALRFGELKGETEVEIRERLVSILQNLELPTTIPNELLESANRYQQLCEKCGSLEAYEFVTQQDVTKTAEETRLIKEAENFSKPWAQAFTADKKRSTDGLHFVFVGPIGASKISSVHVAELLASIATSSRRQS